MSDCLIVKSLKMYLLSIAFLATSALSGQIGKTKIDSVKLIGTYKDDSRQFVQFKKNHEFKFTLVAPRSLVERGFWEIEDDTLICTITRINTIFQGDNKKLKEHPVILKFFDSKGKLSMLTWNDGNIFQVYFEKIRNR